MTVLIKDSQRSLKTDKKRIRIITEDLLTSLGLQGKDLSLLLVNNRAIKKMNKSWFGKDRPTNVISFSYMDSSPASFLEEYEEGVVKNDQSAEIIGDIIISLERAKEEAEAATCPFYERLFALVVHGLVHVLGFNHETGKNEARRMKYRENKLLDYVRSHKSYKDLVFKQVGSNQ